MRKSTATPGPRPPPPSRLHRPKGDAITWPMPCTVRRCFGDDDSPNPLAPVFNAIPSTVYFVLTATEGTFSTPQPACISSSVLGSVSRPLPERTGASRWTNDPIQWIKSIIPRETRPTQGDTTTPSRDKLLCPPGWRTKREATRPQRGGRFDECGQYALCPVLSVV